MGVKSYSVLANPVAGDTGTNLDQLVQVINNDLGLAGDNTGAAIAGGAAAANTLNHLIVEAANFVHAPTNGVFSVAEVLAMNDYIRTHHAAEWATAHGDDTVDLETGFHQVETNGASARWRGLSVVDQVAEGIYNLGFEVVDGHFQNEDGNPNASVEDVAAWLTKFYADRSTTNTRLDKIVDILDADSGLAKNISDADFTAGLAAANGINKLIAQGIAATGVGSDGWISADDVKAINTWIRADVGRYNQFVTFHGDDEWDMETGYHLLQNDGGSTAMFGQNFVNGIVDSIFHIGFEIRNGRFLNEDGNQNATVVDVANWINYFYSDQSTTGTGLDRIVDTIKSDRGLARNTDAGEIVDGAIAADGMNKIIVKAIAATNAMADGWLTAEDMVAMNTYIKNKWQSDWTLLHGDDEGGESWGFHLVQGNGGTSEVFDENLINTIADGIYHLGFDIEEGRFVNEDGDQNARVEDVATWLNYFYGQKTITLGGDGSDTITGKVLGEEIDAGDGNDKVTAAGGNDLVYGGWGDDTVNGGAGDDLVYGGHGDDKLDGGNGSDIYRVSGNEDEGWCSFEGYDTYADTGTDGTDKIVATGGGAVDIGLAKFGADNGIETIDGRGAESVRLLGDWKSNTLDFRTTTFVGGNIVIDGGDGEDTIYGTAGNDKMVGGRGDDVLDGAGGSDKYLVSGNEDEGWCSFQGYDTYADKGTDGTDAIVATGGGLVDVGLTGFGAASGIETVDGTNSERTRLLGDWKSNTLDFRTTTFVGNVVIDGGDGDDKIYGTQAGAIIIGGRGNDKLNGVGGSDKYIVTGNEEEGWCSFQGYDTYADGGTNGTDKIIAVGEGDVDIGLTGFSSKSGVEVVDGTGALGTVRLLGDWKANTLDFRTTTFVGTNIVIDGGDGNDTIFGTQAGATIVGGRGDDKLNGVGGADTYVVTGNEAGGWESFQGYDTYGDTGTNGSDKIVARGDGDVDIGLTKFDAKSGIEVVDGSEALGTVRLLGDWKGNTLDFRGVSILGGNVVIDGGDGNDTIYGTSAADTIVGNRGDDKMNGGGGDDTYVVTGNEAGGWESFHGYDTYADTGGSSGDTIVARGEEGVDIGLTGFLSTNGIDAVDGNEAYGTVRLLGNWKGNTLDFRNVTFLSSNIVIDGGDGDDKIIGTAGDDAVTGGFGNDTLTGGAGRDGFLFDTDLSTWGNIDTITDFVVGVDVIRLSGEVFEALADLPFLEDDAFAIGTGATRSTDHVIYNNLTGALYYDSDGVGGSDKIQFAKLAAGLALTAESFEITGDFWIG